MVNVGVNEGTVSMEIVVVAVNDVLWQAGSKRTCCMKRTRLKR